MVSFTPVTTTPKIQLAGKGLPAGLLCYHFPNPGSQIMTLGVYPIRALDAANTRTPCASVLSQGDSSLAFSPHHHSSPSTMPPKSKKPSLWSRFLSSRFASVFRGRGGRLAVDSRQGSAEITNPGGGALGSDHASTRSAPNLSLPVDNSTLQCHESLPPIGQSRSESDIVEHMQSAALSMSNNEGALQQPPHHPIPSRQSHNNPPVSSAHGGPAPSLPSISGQFGPSWPDHPPTPTVPNLLLPTGSPTPQYHESLPPIYPSRSENNMGESSHPAALSMPCNDLLRQHPHPPLPSLQPFDNPAASGAHGGAAAFFSGASRFQVGAFNVNVNSAGDRSTDGTSIH
jgi:hypothetical protein